MRQECMTTYSEQQYKTQEQENKHKGSSEDIE